MTDRDLDIPELHLALSAAATRARPVRHPRLRAVRDLATAGRIGRARTTERARPSASRAFRPVRGRVVAALCVAVVALLGVVGIGSSVATPGPQAAVTGATHGPLAAPAVLRCALAALPASVLPEPTAVVRDAGAC